VTITIKEFGAVGDGKTLDTLAIQRAIDQAATQQQPVVIPTGTYLTGSLFLKSGSDIRFESGAKLLGSTNILDYPEVMARVAGVEMLWPAAIINALDIENVKISGPGVIDGQGPFWWNLYWGADQKGGKRAEYDANDLRWIADYAIKRPRELLFHGATQVDIRDITLQHSGFWNLQLTYCDHVLVQNVTVRENNGPSTDGIDIDSSTNVRITNSRLACGDDCIVVKSGRDGDGYRVNKVAEKIEIDHCEIFSGYGITLGSEVSGGVRDVFIHDITYHNSDCGLRMKSSKERGGFIENIRVENLTMENVLFPFSWLMDWHNAYNKKIYDNLASLPVAWQAVVAKVPEELQMTKVQNITIENVVATLTADYALPARAFDLVAFQEKPMDNIIFKNCQIEAKEFGRIEAVNNLQLQNVTVSVAGGNDKTNDTFDNR
jgi:polygalacturonase